MRLYLAGLDILGDSLGMSAVIRCGMVRTGKMLIEVLGSWFGFGLSIMTFEWEKPRAR
jgi:hypothetical protein